MSDKDLKDEFTEVEESLKAQGYSGKPLKLETYRRMLKPVRKRVYKIYSDMVDNLDRLDRDPVHKQILETSRKPKRKYHSDYEETMKMAIKKCKYLIHKAANAESDLLLNATL